MMRLQTTLVCFLVHSVLLYFAGMLYCLICSFLFLLSYFLAPRHPHARGSSQHSRVSGAGLFLLIYPLLLPWSYIHKIICVVFLLCFYVCKQESHILFYYSHDHIIRNKKSKIRTYDFGWKLAVHVGFQSSQQQLASKDNVNIYKYIKIIFGLI